MVYEISLNTIQSFVRTAQLGNITSAAKELHISQPALSKQISHLENQLHFQLLNRSKTGVTLTAKGKIFYNSCLPILESYQNLEYTISHINGKVRGKLRIGFQKSTEILFKNNNGRFTRIYPFIRLESIRQASRNFLDGLSSGELDAAYLHEDEIMVRYKDIESIEIARLPNMLLVSTDNPLADREKVHVRELKYESFVCPSLTNSPKKAELFEVCCNQYGFSPKCVARANTIVDYITGVVGFKCVTILPYIPEVALDPNVQYVRLEGFPEKYPLCLAWNKNRKNEILSLYIDFVEQQKYYQPKKLESI